MSASEFALDETDLKILSELQADGRLSNIQLAKLVGLTPTPCLERVKRLERHGVIQGYHARINPDALGLGMIVFVEVTTERATAPEHELFRAAVQRLPEVLECHMVGGGFDFLLKARVADMNDYRDFFHRMLAELPGIRATQTYFVIEELKSTPVLPVGTAE